MSVAISFLQRSICQKLHGVARLHPNLCRLGAVAVSPFDRIVLETVKKVVCSVEHVFGALKNVAGAPFFKGCTLKKALIHTGEALGEAVSLPIHLFTSPYQCIGYVRDVTFVQRLPAYIHPGDEGLDEI